MDKVEKFKELLDNLLEIIESKNGEFEQFVKAREELIKMYEEKQEKPVIKCKYGFELSKIYQK